jgi:hypothetical protein
VVHLHVTLVPRLHIEYASPTFGGFVVSKDFISNVNNYYSPSVVLPAFGAPLKRCIFDETRATCGRVADSKK